ncbi:maleylpyruvate isomerase N-terminal domain-containing protein, partial [Streptomyces toxytricini]|uniref:maleylpyruvate isomerase N-terminal domain-containing protein n=1 Tax=Streptomyces toxytricini TaxID=67369 RepID=UPI00344911B2
MAPRTRRPRTYDAVKIRAVVTAQFAHLADAVPELTPEQLARPAGLGDWTVADLAAHVAWIADSLAGR